MYNLPKLKIMKGHQTYKYYLGRNQLEPQMNFVMSGEYAKVPIKITFFWPLNLLPGLAHMVSKSE